MLSSQSASADAAPDGRVAGWILMIGSVASVIAITHHPTIAHRDGDLARQMAGLAAVDRIVHGALIATYGGFLFAMSVFSARCGTASQRAIAARIAYAIGVGAIFAAALVDGFLLPALGDRAAAPEMGPAFVQQLAGWGALIEVATKFATAAMSVAMLLWSLILIGGRGSIRAVGMLGLVVAIASPAVTFLSGTLNPHNLAALLVLQGAWYAWVGALMVQRRL